MNTNDSNMPKDYKRNFERKNDNSHIRIAICLEAIIGAIYKIDRNMDEIIELQSIGKNLLISIIKI